MRIGRLTITLGASSVAVAGDGSDADWILVRLASCCVEHGSRGERIAHALSDAGQPGAPRRLAWDTSRPGYYLLTQLPMNTDKKSQHLFEICSDGRVRRPRFEEAARRLPCQLCAINAEIAAQDRADNLPPLEGSPRQRQWGLWLRRRLLELIGQELEEERAELRRRALEIRAAASFIARKDNLLSLLNRDEKSSCSAGPSAP